MANDLILIDNSGASVAGLDDAKAVFDQSVVNAFGGDIDRHVHTPQAQFAAISASIWAEMGEEIMRAVVYGADLDHAPGKFLDAMGSLLDVRRRPAIRSRLVAQATGVGGTVIPRGSIVEDAEGNRFTSDVDVSIPSGGASASVPLTAIEYGPIPVDAQSITKIISVRNGWETIRNDAAGVVGADAESDAEYRANIKARTAQNATASVSALESALSAAGASKFKVIENTSNASQAIGGITIPAHSVCVAVTGGLSDDISRAVQNSRGMGVNVYSASEGASDYSSTAVAGMNAARFRFNDTLFKDIDLSGQGSLEAIVTTLNAYPNKPADYPSFSTNGESLLAFYDWGTDDSGFEDTGGSPSLATPVEQGFHVKSALIQGSRVRVAFTERVESVGTGSDAPVVKYKAAGSSSLTSVAVGSIYTWGNVIDIDLASSVPATATEMQIDFTGAGSTSHVVSVYDNRSDPVIPLTLVTMEDGDAPAHIEVWAEARSQGVQWWASAFVASGDSNGISKWQYRRFDGVQIIPADAAWVDVSNSASVRKSGSLTGYTNNYIGARLELRAVTTGGASAIAHSADFSPSGAGVTITEGSVDGESIVLESSVPLLPSHHTVAATWWGVTLSSGASRSITEQRTRGNRIYLRVNSAVPAADTITLSYTSPASGYRIRSYANVQMSTTSSISIDNETEDKVPGRPSYVSAHRTYPSQPGTTLVWTNNDNGGSSVDRYEYRTRTSSSARWSGWQPISNANLRTLDILGDYDEVQMRASNPNVRFAEVFGIQTGSPVFVRSVDFPLTIGIDLKTTDTLTGNVIENIRDAIIRRVEQYDLGERIWANDIFALVERITGTEVKFNSSDTYVRYKGIGVNADNAHAVPFFARWVARPADVRIVFTA